MKKMLVLAMTMAMVLLAAAGVCETLRVGMECNYAPYNWTQSDASENAVAIAAGGYADGYDVRIAKIIADKLGMDLEIVKQGELDKANRGIAKFDELRELFISYANDAYTANAALDDGWLAIMNNDREAYERNINILNTVYPRMDTTIDQILQLFDDIENKNY